MADQYGRVHYEGELTIRTVAIDIASHCILIAVLTFT
jgi:hypothetical protein